MRTFSTLSLFALTLPVFSMPNVAVRSPSPEALAAPQPLTPAPVEPRTWNKWNNWDGPSACDNHDKRQKCYEIGKDCNEKCVCIPWNDCGAAAPFWCNLWHGQLNWDTCRCTIPTKQPGWPGHYRKREFNCPAGLTECAIDFKSTKKECLDTRTSLDSCGGCATEGTGVDCAAIPNVMDVSCQAGECLIHSCERGFKLENGTACVEDLSVDGSKSFVVGALKGAEKFWGY